LPSPGNNYDSFVILVPSPVCRKLQARRRHATVLLKPCAAGAVCSTLVQLVENAVALHCHPAPSSGIEIGLGYSNATAANAAIEASVAEMNTNALLVRQLFRDVPGIAVTPVATQRE
jgi:hypothetical protein